MKNQKRNDSWLKGKGIENEKEIKDNCEIYINDKLIPFSYFYKFNKKGKYTIKYNFKDNIKNMNFMFYLCSSLTNINLSNFNTNNVTNMNHMFSSCSSLTSLNLSNFNTNNVNNMECMFYNKFLIKIINYNPLISFSFSNIF